MSNTHTIADTMAEIMAREEDLLPACVISTTWPTVPVSSMTLAAFTTQAYVRDGQHLVYADQPAITLPLSGSAGTYWLAISRDVSTAYATWTRRAGSHYLWQLAGSRPPDVDGLLVFASVTVAGGVITAVTPAPGVTRAERWRTLAALGSMATQNASAVAITGGTITLAASTGPGAINVANVATEGVVAVRSGVTAGTDKWNLFCEGTAPNYLAGALGVRATPLANTALYLGLAGGIYGLVTFATDQPNAIPLEFRNQALAPVGSITSSATATAYNTTSDARLKEFVEDLTGELDVLAALRPVRFRWRADGSEGVGFLAQEVASVVDGVVSGEPDAVEDDGRIRPMQIDYSKLVPWLVGACKTLAARLEATEARLAVLEDALGV